MNIQFENQDQFDNLIGTRLDGWWVIVTDRTGRSYEGYATISYDDEQQRISVVNDDSTVIDGGPLEDVVTIEVA